MERIELACYSLIASAFVLAGMLLTQLPDQMVQSAQGGLVLNRETLTLMTARTRPDEEALFVLDGSKGKLLIYRLNVGKKQLELSGSADLNHIFHGPKEDQDSPNARGR